MFEQCLFVEAKLTNHLLHISEKNVKKVTILNCINVKKKLKMAYFTNFGKSQNKIATIWGISYGYALKKLISIIPHGAIDLPRLWPN